MKSNRKIKRQRIKAERKLSKAAKKGKLRKNVKDRVNEVKSRRMASNQKLFAQIERDWIIDRRLRRREQEELSIDGSSSSIDDLVDMLDPDLFPDTPVNGNPRNKGNAEANEDDEKEMDPDEWDEQVRTFLSEEELLPIKVGGKIVKRVKPVLEEKLEEIKMESEMDEKEEGNTEKPEHQSQLDLSKMSEQELIAHCNKLLAETESTIASVADHIIMDPQENIVKLNQLLKMAAGEELASPLIRESIQKLSTASLAELFINVIPGYVIHTFTEVEKTQKMKKETKRLVAFEQSLLNYYSKYLKLLEKNATKLITKKPDASIFATQYSFLCAKCLCRLAESCTHFNYASSIITCLVRLSMSKWDKLLDIICATLSRIFAADRQLKVSLQGVKAISTLVDKKKAYVPAELISTLLSLNIKDINRDLTNRKKEKRKVISGKKSKRARKCDKLVGRLETDLEEAVAAKTLSTREQMATEVMKHVFIIYFRILRQMPQTALLCPVLAGLSKFVHLINVEFYGDLILHLGRLVEQKQLKFSETLNCVRTASFILTGEGQAIDVDLQKFYKALFAAMPNICFQPEKEIDTDISLLINAIQILLVQRRKTVPLARVAGFAKRLALISIAMRTSHAIELLLLLRKLFITHSGLKSLIEEEDSEDFLVVSGQFRPDCADPDYSNSLSTSLIDELRLLSTHKNKLIQTLALHILNGSPISGKYRLDAKWINAEPCEIMMTLSNEPAVMEDDKPHFLVEIHSFCKRQKQVYCSGKLCSILCLFLDDLKKRNIRKK